MAERRSRPSPPAGRRESDSLGELEIPGSALYGIQTMRSVRNLSFSGRTLGQFPAYVDALAVVKRAAACANRDAGVLQTRIARDRRRRAAVMQGDTQISFQSMCWAAAVKSP